MQTPTHTPFSLLPLTLAQAESAGAAGAASPPPIAGRPETGSGPGPATSGSQPLGAPGGAAPSPMGGSSMLLLVGVVFLVMILMQVLTGRKEKKRREEMLTGLRRGDRVQTIGGMLGSVAEVRDDEVVLKVDESTNTKVRVVRSAIQNVLKRPETKPGEELAAADAAR